MTMIKFNKPKVKGLKGDNIIIFQELKEIKI